MVKTTKIIACGAYLPSKIVSNQELSKIVDTSDEWITSRTGIKQRHLIENDETTSFLAINAAKLALERSKLKPSDIDLIIVATTTPDKTFPATAVLVQASLGIEKGAAFDVQAVCAGFVYALTIADSMIKSGSASNAIVIGAEAMSKIIDWQDRNTCVLFGDGAGAVILSPELNNTGKGILSTSIFSDGRYEPILHADGGVCSTQTSGFVRMQGKEVFKHAVEKMSESMLGVLGKSGLSLGDVDHVIPHQANMRILEAVATRLKLPQEKMVITLDKHANTSAASIPLALNHLFESGKLKNGDLILTAAIGGGLSWGACLFRW